MGEGVIQPVICSALGHRREAISPSLEVKKRLVTSQAITRLPISPGPAPGFFNNAFPTTAHRAPRQRQRHPKRNPRPPSGKSRSAKPSQLNQTARAQGIRRRSLDIVLQWCVIQDHALCYRTILTYSRLSSWRKCTSTKTSRPKLSAAVVSLSTKISIAVASRKSNGTAKDWATNLIENKATRFPRTSRTLSLEITRPALSTSTSAPCLAPPSSTTI